MTNFLLTAAAVAAFLAGQPWLANICCGGIVLSMMGGSSK